jgi:hypothetical protein
MLDLAGPALQQVSPGKYASPTPALSPLGTCLAYVDDEGPARGEFYFHLISVERDRQPISWLVADSKRLDRWPEPIAWMVWSPDGRKLAYPVRSPDALIIWDLASNVRTEYPSLAGGISPLVWEPGSTAVLVEASGKYLTIDVVEGNVRESGKACCFSAPVNYQWLPNTKQVITPGILGSDLIDTATGVERKLPYPWQDSDLTLFWGPVGP